MYRSFSFFLPDCSEASSQAKRSAHPSNTVSTMPTVYTQKPARCGLKVTLDVVANTELLDEFAVFEDVAVLDVDEQATTLTNEHEQTAARMVILGVLFEVLGEVADALGEDRDLNFSATRILSILAIFGDELCGALL